MSKTIRIGTRDSELSTMASKYRKKTARRTGIPNGISPCKSYGRFSF